MEEGTDLAAAEENWALLRRRVLALPSTPPEESLTGLTLEEFTAKLASLTSELRAAFTVLHTCVERSRNLAREQWRSNGSGSGAAIARVRESEKMLQKYNAEFALFESAIAAAR